MARQMKQIKLDFADDQKSLTFASDDVALLRISQFKVKAVIPPEEKGGEWETLFEKSTKELSKVTVEF